MPTFFGGAAYVTAHAVKVWGLEPLSSGILLGAAGAARPGPRRRLPRHPPAGHLLRDDHAGAVADVLLLLPAGAVHPWRGRHPGRAARHLLGVHRPQPAADHVLLRRWRSSCSASSPSGASSTRPSARSCKAIRENEKRAISLGYRVDRYKLGAFVMSAALAGLAGGTKAHRLPVRHAHRRALADVGRGDPDDAARRHRHADRARSSAPAW